MLGIDSSWSYTSRDFVEYPNLEPGKYRFEVQANTRKGGWSREMAGIDFEISVPFWRTGWFMFSVPFAVLSIVIVLLVTRISEIKRKNEVERRALEAEQRLLSVQMNPHFIFNALNSMQSHFFMGDLARYNEYLGDLSRVIRTILEHSRCTLIGLDEEIRFVSDYVKLQALRLNGGFSFELVVMKGMKPIDFKIPPMLLQPFVENAILHGLSPKEGLGKLIISFGLENGFIRCVVEDDGVGRNQSLINRTSGQGQTRKSLALEITKERIEILNKTKRAGIQLVIDDLFDDNGRPIGTRIILLLAREIQW
jgi:LytS/YehU family sensor histidine kinase